MRKKDKKDEYEGIDEEDLEEEEKAMLKPKAKPKAKVVKKEPTAPVSRYVVFSVPNQLGIMDAETKEVIGEGEVAPLQVLANILDRLERIENNLGSMME